MKALSVVVGIVVVLLVIIALAALFGGAQPPEPTLPLKAYCDQEGVVGVYECHGGIAKVVYSTPGTGYKLVKPDGTEIPCPVVAPDAMSGDCKNVLQAGYCSEENACEGGGAGLANPASVYCEDQGGTLRFFTGEQGSIGVCEFNDGSACEEWDYYRGDCAPGECEIKCEDVGAEKGWSLVCDDHGEVLEIADCDGGGAGLANPASVYCEEQGGTLRSFTTDEGTLSVCEFTDGSACKQWDYYRGDCFPGDCEVKCHAIGTRSEGWYYICDEVEERLEFADCGEEAGEFCGWSTNSSCDYDTDCAPGGCSSQVCGGAGEGIITTCEYIECYDAIFYGLSCLCVDNECRWA